MPALQTHTEYLIPEADSADRANIRKGRRSAIHAGGRQRISRGRNPKIN